MSNIARLFFLIISGLLFFTLTSPVLADWPMVAANPERTSWASDAVTAGATVEWYRPIDAFIPPHFQVITANDLVYLSTARGLFVFRYDTGALAWRYDTDIPLGNSPTIATVNGTSMAFVGGYDKKIHAFNALSGASIWEYAGAKAGYASNPLVIDNVLYIGNRDGHLYAVNAASGALLWQYPPAGQDGIGPIYHPPAYKNGVIYFATGYQYGYAVNVNGTLKWKSPAKLPGDGFVSYWPVVYTNPADSKTYVIFSINNPYREYSDPGAMSIDPSGEYSFLTSGLGSYGNQVVVGGKTFLDFSNVAIFYGQKPWRRNYAILDDAQNGQEYTFQVNGQVGYLPATPIENPSTQHPPVLGSDGLLYVSNILSNFRAHATGWKFGTPYVYDGRTDSAGDEPQLLSAGGSHIYRALCCSRIGDYFNITTNSISQLWGYTLSDLAPGYDTKLYYLENPDGMANLTAIFGGVNGVYGYHGDGNPIVPYKGKAFTHKGNSLIAFGTGGNRCTQARTVAGHCFPTFTSTPVSLPPLQPSLDELKSRLDQEVSKATTLLKPGYYSDSHFSTSYNHMDNYFENPGDTLYTLSLAYDHLSATTKTQVKNFLQQTFIPRYFSPVIRFRIGWKDGLQRDSVSYPQEVAADMQTLNDNWTNGYEGRWSWFHNIQVNPNIFYALYKYAQKVVPDNPNPVYQIAKTYLTESSACQWRDCFKVEASDSYLIQQPWELNAYIAGYRGFLNLQTLAHQETVDASLRTRATSELNRLTTLLMNNFTMDTPYTNAQNGMGKNFINLSRNFMMLTPELATTLRQNSTIMSKIQTALPTYYQVGSYWFVPKFNSGANESGFQNLYDYPSLFAMKSMILQESREELYKWLEAPAFERGDLFYIQNLVATIEAPSSGNAPTPTPSASPTVTPTKPGDANNDNRVDGVDFMVWRNHYNQAVTGPSVGDFNSSGRVDGVDFMIWRNNYGK